MFCSVRRGIFLEFFQAIFAAEIDFLSPLLGMKGGILVDAHGTDRIFEDIFFCRFIRVKCLILAMMSMLLMHILFFLHNESGIPMAHRMNDEKWQFDERADQPYAVADTVGDLFALGLPLLWV